MKTAEDCTIIDMRIAKLRRLSPADLVMSRNQWKREYMYYESADFGYEPKMSQRAFENLVVYESEIKRRNILVTKDSLGMWRL